MSFKTDIINGKVMLTSFSTDLEDAKLPVKDEDGNIIEGIASQAILGEEFSTLYIPGTYEYLENDAVVDCYNLTEVYFDANENSGEINLDEIFIKESLIGFNINKDTKKIYKTNKYVTVKAGDVFEEEGIEYVGTANKIEITSFPDKRSIYIPDKFGNKDVYISQEVKNTENIEKIRFPKSMRDMNRYIRYTCLEETIYSAKATQVALPVAKELSKVVLGKDVEKIYTSDEYLFLEDMNIERNDVDINLRSFEDSKWLEEFEKSAQYREIEKNKKAKIGKKIEAPKSFEDSDIDDINNAFADFIDELMKEAAADGIPKEERDKMANIVNLTRKLAVTEKLASMNEDERNKELDKLIDKENKIQGRIIKNNDINLYNKPDKYGRF